MSNKNWVCFTCRTATRRSAYARSRAVDVRCRSCASPCTFLGHKIRIPPKTNVRAWATLHQALTEVTRARWLVAERNAVRYRHDLERQIAIVERRPSSRERRSLLRRLRKDLYTATPYSVL